MNLEPGSGAGVYACCIGRLINRHRGHLLRRGRNALGELKVTDTGPPVKLARGRVILVRVPKSAVILRIYAQRAIVAPTIASTALAAGARKESSFTLSQGIDRIRREPAGVAQSRKSRRSRCAVP